MRERLAQIQTVSKDYIANVKRIMQYGVKAVLQKGYQDAYAQGEADIARQKYGRPSESTFRRPDKLGGATQLAAVLANAVAQGYTTAGTEARSSLKALQRFHRTRPYFLSSAPNLKKNGRWIHVIRVPFDFWSKCAAQTPVKSAII